MSETITINKAKVGAYVATLPIGTIKIANRFRQDHGDLDALAASIKELGLLQPIGIDRDHHLIFGHRRYLAHQRLGMETIQARIIEVPSLLQAEHDENELRKGFTPSERVAIAEAIKAEIGNRQGQRTDLAEPLQNFAQVEPGQTTREAVAKAAGFGNAETYRQAKTVVDKADPALVQAMDKGDIAISTAARLAEADPLVQREAVANPKTAPQIAKQVAVGKHEKLQFPDSAKRLPSPGIDDVLIDSPSKPIAAGKNEKPTLNRWDRSWFCKQVVNILNDLKGNERFLEEKDRDTLLCNLRAAIARIEKAMDGKSTQKEAPVSGDLVTMTNGLFISLGSALADFLNHSHLFIDANEPLLSEAKAAGERLQKKLDAYAEAQNKKPTPEAPGMGRMRLPIASREGQRGEC